MENITDSLHNNQMSHNSTSIKKIKINSYLAFGLTFVLAGTFSGTIFNSNNKINDSYGQKVNNKIVTQSIDDDSKNDITELYDSINSNKNLNEIEKKIIDNSWCFLDDYSEYINFETISERLKNFDIEYKESKKETSVSGTWDPEKNIMVLYDIKDQYQILDKPSSVNHEFIHLIGSNDKYYPSALKEGIDSLCCVEYGLDNINGYCKQLIITQMLCEILDPKLVMESYLKQDFNIIREGLLNIYDSNKKVDELVESLDNFQSLFYEINDKRREPLNNSEKELIREKIIKQNMELKTIDSLLCFYFTKATGRSVGNINDNDVCNKGLISEEYDPVMSIYSTELKKNYYLYNSSNSTYAYKFYYSSQTSYFNFRHDYLDDQIDTLEYNFIIEHDDEDKAIVKKVTIN